MLCYTVLPNSVAVFETVFVYHEGSLEAASSRFSLNPLCLFSLCNASVYKSFGGGEG